MEIFTVVGVVGFILRLAYKLSGLVFLWWRKEYRFDRMMIHLRTRQGRSIWGGKTNVLFALLLLCWFILPRKDSIVIITSVTVFVIGIWYLRRVRQWLFPPVSPKVMAILVTTIFFGVTFVQIQIFPLVISLLFIDLVLFPLTGIIVLVVTLPTLLYHRFVIWRAEKLLRAHKKMMVIGITGSFGKTSVKDYLATILSRYKKTLKTDASKNSPIGIGETVLRSLTPDTQAFVVEMGAYKRGEIRDMCRMVGPEIGIITAINPQHQDLFGSIETTMKAKYELVQGLTERKLVIANADDPNVVTMGEWAKRDGCEVIWYSKKKNAKNIVSHVSGTCFEAVFEKETARLETRIVGEHQVSNILAAIVAARACGITLSDAAEVASAIQPTTGVMEVKKGINGSLFIDDTFNNNPDAAKAAVAFLAKNKGKKFLVFQPMIELGAYADRCHEEVGAAAAASADAILLTNANWFLPFERGVHRVSKKVPLMVVSPTQAADYLRLHVKKGDMVLFKGKDAKHTLDLLA